MTELVSFIQTYFSTNQQTTDQLASLFKSQKISKDSFLLKEGQYNASLSFIQTGILRVYRISNGKEITQYLSSPGEFATELGSLLFDQPARWHIQAITDTDLLTISHEDYKKLPELIPDWLKYERLFFSKCFMFIEDRVHTFLSMSAEERFDFLYTNRQELFKHAPQQYIASMLGITPETFSRIRRKKLS